MNDNEKAQGRFAITQGKGFHISFNNGYMVSVQFGKNNYCERRDITALLSELDDYKQREATSRNAEVAVVTSSEEWATNWPHADKDQNVTGWLTPNQVLDVLVWAAAQPKKG